ncbi:hypothetical protein ACA910_011044 [Epithemia clementina (nom. ined.)]
MASPVTILRQSRVPMPVNKGELMNNEDLDRRQFVVNSVAGLGFLPAITFGGSLAYFPSPAAAEPTLGSSPEHPIVILGAGGKVGKMCIELLANRGLYCRAMTRQGRTVLEQESEYVTYGAADVTKLDTLREAVRGADGVIFAASASGKKKGGDPAHVDYLGAYNAAVACIEENVPKLAVVSAGTVTRPDSVGYQATNFFVKFVYGENIMGYKIAGEEAVRDAYAAANKPGVSYTIIRPGGLSDGVSVGPGKVHLSQGDVYSSEIPRIDVAQVTVAALLKGPATDFTTFELNQQEGLQKALSTLPDLDSQLIHTGKASYDALLDGLLTDADMRQKYPDLMSGFKGGDKIEPLSSLQR